MNDIQRSPKRVSPQQYLEQRQEQLGIAVSEFRTDIPGVPRGKAKQDARDTAQKRCQDELQRAFNADEPVLLEALMGLGKSHGGPKLSKILDELITVFCGRGHKGQYEQYRTWCDSYNLDYYQLPSFLRDCETARGDHSEREQRQVKNWYSNGVLPSAIHKYGNPPCTTTGKCDYEERLNFNPDSYDVLIGDYSHAYNPRNTKSRTSIFDEFPGARFITEFPSPQGMISQFLTQTNLPFNTFSELLQKRNQIEWIQIANFRKNYNILNKNSARIINSTNNNQHALTPFLIYALLQMDDLGNGWESAKISNWRVAHNKSNNHLHVLQSPNLDYAKQVIGLDGTPSYRQWNLALGYLDDRNEQLDHRRVLTDAERRKYLQNVLDLKIVQTTDNIKTYSSGNYVSLNEDLSYIETVKDQYGRKPTLFTSQAAESQYKQSGVMDHIKTTEHFGNIRGENRFGDTRLSVVIGSPHRGDEWVEKWSALMEQSTTRQGKGKQLTYTGVGEEFLCQMREQEILQTIMRVGRDSKGAIVYVHTGAIPEWVPIAHGPDMCEITTWTDEQTNIIQAVADIGTGTTTEIVGHSDVTCTRQYATRFLKRLVQLGYVSKEDTGNGYEWSDAGVATIELPVDVRFTYPCQAILN